jgi:hypothetical protein
MMNQRFLFAALFAWAFSLGGQLAAQAPAPAAPPAGQPAAVPQGPARGGRGGRGGYQPPAGPAPRLPWGKPDFNGVWSRPYTANIEQRGTTLPYTEWGKKEWENYHAEDGDYTGSCLPFGYVRSVNSPDPVHIMQSEKNLAFLWEQDSWYKVLNIDGTKALTKGVPTWFGDSVGHWDGDTLVIETSNFNGLTKLDTAGHPHSDQLKTTERYVRTDLGHIAYQLTIEDPKTYTKPIVSNRTFTLRPDWEVLEYSCEENNVGLVEGRIKVPKNVTGDK